MGQDFAKIWPSQAVFRKGCGPTKESDCKLGAGLMPLVQLEHTLYRTRVGQEGACDWGGGVRQEVGEGKRRSLTLSTY